MVPDAPLLHAAMLRWLDELSNQGIITTDNELRIRGWNRWLERHTTRTAESVLGQPLLTACPEIASRGLDGYYRAALQGEVRVLSQTLHRYLIEIPIRRDRTTGAMPQSCRIAPLAAEGQIVGTITIIDDVSDRVWSETELRRQIASAEEARELAQEALRLKDEFLATLSHEIRTPLNAVVGWTRILLSRPVDPPTLQNALHVIDRNARAQSRLVEDMLDMARIVTGKLRLDMAPMDLLTAITAAIDVVAPAAAAKGVRIHASLGDGPRAIVADADRVQQIAWNLLSNAVKFTPPGGTVEVIVPDDLPVRLVVKDTGQGISPDFLPFVFERFRQANASTNRTEGGLGLGLALVRQLVELHGGMIRAESAGRGQGAVFTVTFPEQKQEAPVDSALPRALSGHPLAGIELLLIDDDADWRQLLSLALEGLGANVLSAASVPDAIALLESERTLDIVLADIAMPGEDGFAFLEAMRGLNGTLSGIPVIAVTAHAGAENEARALSAGFKMHCSKPLDPDTVARAILKVVGRQAIR
jgi:signal transduction histidine kinase/CheY-like chemotaxis protein